MTTFGQILLGSALLFLGGGAVRMVGRDVGRALPDRQRQKVAAARREVAAKAAPVITPARKAAATATAPLRSARSRARSKTFFQHVVFRGAPPPGMGRAVPPAASPAPAVKPDTRPAPRPAPSPAPVAAPVLTEVKPMAPNAATPGGAGADLFAAVQHIINHASAGGVRSKLRAITQFDEALGYEAGSLEGFAQRLAEPDQAYASSVWEPVAMAAAHMRAAQMQMAEAGSALRHIMSVTVGEAAGSGTRVPHHDQINSGQ